MGLFLDSLNVRALADFRGLLLFPHAPFTVVQGIQLEGLDQLLGKKIFVFMTVKGGFATDNKVEGLRLLDKYYFVADVLLLAGMG